jgi:quercetin dioxygenase-like cupin family protein
MPQPQDQITSVATGEIDFIVAGEPVTLRAGQTAALPGDRPHAARVGDQGAETINVWTSRR